MCGVVVCGYSEYKVMKLNVFSFDCLYYLFFYMFWLGFFIFFVLMFVVVLMILVICEDLGFMKL